MKYSSFATVSLLAACALVACSDTTGATDAAPSRDALESADWCAHVAAGPPGTDDPRIALSAAHANVRFFGVHPSLNAVDQALAASLGDPGPFAPKRALAKYTSQLGGAACALTADAKPLGPARVRSLGPVAIVRPGTGNVSLPPNTRAVIVDLRGLPAVDGLRSALEAAVAPALASPIARARSHVREHFGMGHEARPGGYYVNRVAVVEQGAVPASGPSDLPLVLLTSKALAPEAAELAMTLRLANRAWIAGQSVRAEAAEARWTAVRDAGLAWRAQEFYTGDTRWPDEVPADVLEQEATNAARLGVPSPIASGSAQRPKLEPIVPTYQPQPATLGLGEARAALLAAHGATRRFFPYFKVTGDHIDERLHETLDTLEALPSLERAPVRNLLRRFGEVLHDGHNYIRDYGVPSTAGYFPVVIEEVNGEPVVTRTAAAGVHPGDAIVSIGNLSTAEWYAREIRLTSAATEGYRRFAALDSMTVLDGPTEFGLRAPDGATRSVTVQPVSQQEYAAFGRGPTARATGPLTDLGQPELYYMNVDLLSTEDEFRNALAETGGAHGLILDMRGQPAIDIYELAARLIPHSFSSPIFNTPVVRPASQTFSAEHFDFAPLTNPSYAGPIVLLIRPSAISAAETFATLLVDAKRLTAIVGRRSAGTNGNNTRLFLPGGFSFSFTGMEILHADGSRFHGIGIVPDIEVTPTAQDFHDGRDPELARAVDVLRLR